MANQSDWYDLLETKIYNKVAKFIAKENGSEVFCTTDEVNVSETEFPTVWIHELEGLERGMDLTNMTLNAVLYSVQIDVFSKTKSEAQRLMRYATASMKTMMFNITSLPLTFQDSPDVYHSVARFRRVIGGGDAI